MSGSGTELWVCRYCRSVNTGRSGKCYRCQTPREVAVARPEELTVHHEESRPEASGRYRSSELRAVFLTVASFALIVASVVGVWLTFQIGRLRLDGHAVDADQLWSQWGLLVLGLPICASLALLAYASWISRLVANLPALGLGYSRVSPGWAFLEPFIPGRNLYSLPARTAEVARKLGQDTRVAPLIGLAWALVVAPMPVLALVARVLTFLRIFGPSILDIDFATYWPPLVLPFEIAGLIVALGVVWRVEALQQARHAAGPATPVPGA